MNKADIVQYIKSEIASILDKDINEIDEEMNFLKIGISSIQALKVINRMRRKLEVEISPVAMFEYKTIDEFAGFLSEQISRSQVM